MSEFKKCLKFSKEMDKRHFFPFYEAHGWKVIEELQPHDDYGDFIIQKNDRIYRVEHKAEEVQYGRGMGTRLALEVISNELTSRPGWIKTSKAEGMLYLAGALLRNPIMYSIGMQQLKRWFIPVEHTYERKPPGRNVRQANRTIICPVTIRDIARNCSSLQEHPLLELGVSNPDKSLIRLGKGER